MDDSLQRKVQVEAPGHSTVQKAENINEFWDSRSSFNLSTSYSAAIGSFWP